MAKFTSALDLYKHQQKRFEEMEGTAADLHRELVKEGWRNGVKLLSGATPSGKARVKALRAAGHPYANSRGLKRGAIRKGGGFKNLPIGNITNRLRRAFKISNKPLPGGGNAGKISFEGAGKSLFVLSPGGTSKMVDRGFWQMIRAQWRPLNKALIDELRRRGRK